MFLSSRISVVLFIKLLQISGHLYPRGGGLLLLLLLLLLKHILT
jgi:uncharacterized membrane protein YjgN (DUF898 family)